MTLFRAPARLHVGLLNESGTWGRIDGSIGFAIADPHWIIEVALDDVPMVFAEAELSRELAAAALALLTKIYAETHVALSINVLKSVPAHAGFGSKTSLLMLLASAAQRLGALPSMDAIGMGAYIGRGGTSGVGVHASQLGGVTLDLGRNFPGDKRAFGPSSTSHSHPPRLARWLPASQLPVVHLRFAESGPAGQEEVDVFRRACPVPVSDTVKIDRLVRTEFVRGLADADEIRINSALGQLQRLGVKREEWNSQAEVTKEFSRYMKARIPDLAICLSSMGPTLFTISNRIAEVMLAVEEFEVNPHHLTQTHMATHGVLERAANSVRTSS